MTTGGEGDMVLTSDSDLCRRMWEYKDHGKSWNAVYNREHPPGFRWLHESFGTNWRLSEMQSAIGRVQLGKLDKWHERRRKNAGILIDGLSGVPGLRVPVPEEGFEHAYYKFYVYVEPERLKPGWSRDRIMKAVVEQGVPCFQGICPEVYLEKAFDGRGQKPEVRGQKSEARSQRAEVRSQKSEGRSQKPEVRGQKSEARSQRSEVRGQKSAERGRKEN
jgi:dTDP-4-amino-4,6-dideoxygalactose transaminase